MRLKAKQASNTAAGQGLHPAHATEGARAG